MKVNIQKYTKRFVPLLTALLVLMACICFPAGASSSAVSYLDLDYDIAVDGENNRITVNIPEEYFLLQIRDHSNNILVSSNGSDSVELWVAQGSEYRVDCYFFKNTHFSVQDLPDGSLFYISFGTEGSSGLLNPGIFMEENWAFDKAGKEIHWYGGDLDGNRFTDTHYLYYYKPAGINASSVAFGINAQECMCIKSGNFQFNVKYCTLEFSISSFLHSQLVNQQNSNLLDEVNKQLEEQGKKMDDFINGTPEQNDQADQFKDNADSVIGDLNEAGDKLSSVEKPDVDVGTFVPDQWLTGTDYLTYTATINNFWSSDILSNITIILGGMLVISYLLFGEKG